MKTLEEIKTMPEIEEITSEDNLLDLVIVGGGPSGLTAALYAGRSRLRTLLIEKALVGGMASTTFHIENYPGFPEGISGIDLSQKFEEQVKKLGVKIHYGDVTRINEDKTIEVGGRKIRAKAIIIASGTETKKLGIPGEEKFIGRGVSYCATCDGPFYKNKNIAVIGGGNAAVEEAIYLTRFANKVSIIHRRDKLRADKILAEQAMNHPKIFIIWNSIAEKIEGKTVIEELTVKNVQTNVSTKIPLSGVFIYVGLNPNTASVKDILKLDKWGYIVVDKEMRTSVPGIFACGDVTDKPLRQIVTAASDGAIAADSARKYIEEKI